MAVSTWSTTDKVASVTLSGSNLIATATVVGTGVRGKDPKRSGQIYFEATGTTWANAATAVGIATSVSNLAVNVTQFGNDFVVVKNGNIWVNGAVATGIPNIGALVNGDTVGIAVDLDARLGWARKAPSGNWNGSATANPATGVGGIDLSSAGLGGGVDAYPLATFNAISDAMTANFGGTAFSGTVPSGYTSGWDDSVAALSMVITTQLGAEAWATSSPAVQVTQIGAEVFAVPTPQAQFTQIGQEVWAVNANPAYQLTQVGLEVWASLTNTTTVALTGRVRSGDMVRGPTTLTGTPITILTLSPAGIVSGETLGTTALVAAVPNLTPAGIPSSEALGTPTFVAEPVITPAGIASSTTLGTLTFVAEPVITPAGIASSTALGTAHLVPGVASMAMTGIASSEALGTPHTVPVLSPTRIKSYGQVLSLPLYVYPGSLWTSAEAAGAVPGSYLVMNPASGPGTSVDSTYAAAVAHAQGTGLKVLGYVHTSYAARPTATVKAEISSYKSWYMVDGIFLDECSSLAGDLAYYADLAEYIRASTGTLSPAGIPSEEALGTPVVEEALPFLLLLVSGIDSEEVHGTPSLVPGSIDMAMTGIDSTEALGIPVLM